MAVIPAGRFRMGCVSGLTCFDRETPVHSVMIPRAFALSVHDVTFAQWDACAAAGGCGRYRPDDHGWGRGRHPVINVSWDEAQEYVAWLSGEANRLESVESRANLCVRRCVRKRRDNPSLGSAHSQFDFFGGVVVRKGVPLSVYLEPKDILHVPFSSHDLERIVVFSPNNASGYGKRNLVDFLGMVIRATYDASQIIPENVNVCYFLRHLFISCLVKIGEVRDLLVALAQRDRLYTGYRKRATCPPVPCASAQRIRCGKLLDLEHEGTIERYWRRRDCVKRVEIDEMDPSVADQGRSFRRTSAEHA